MAGRLYLVGTPIGHLGDATERTREVLSSVDLVAAEDTRRTGVLLKHLGVSARMTSYHDRNERGKAGQLIEALESGDDVAVVSDAGMPLIADPGWHVVQAALVRGIEVTAVPGPSACLMALVLSGLPVHRFAFEGYPPRKTGERRRHFAKLSTDERTMVFYESPHKLRSTLRDMADIFGPRRASISRELTKVHEETIRDTLDKLRDRYDTVTPRGEFVVVVAGMTDEAGMAEASEPDAAFDHEAE